jgi:hypothetical protein
VDPFIAVDVFLELGEPFPDPGMNSLKSVDENIFGHRRSPISQARAACQNRKLPGDAVVLAVAGRAAPEGPVLPVEEEDVPGGLFLVGFIVEFPVARSG